MESAKPRGPRDDAPGVAHHVMARGIERRVIFADDTDRAELLRRLSILLPELGFRCLAWALMPNHFHLVVRSGPVRVSRLMLEGGLVTEPRGIERFSWCGAGALLGRRQPYPFEAVDETLALFADDRACARARGRDWLVRVEGDETGGAPMSLPARQDVPLQLPARAGWPGAARVAELRRDACRRFGATELELCSLRRGAALAAAREAFARRVARELGLTGAEIGRAIGVTPAAVSRMLARKRPEPSPSQPSQ